MKQVLNPGIKPIFYVEKKVSLQNNNSIPSHIKNILLKDDPIFKKMTVKDNI